MGKNMSSWQWYAVKLLFESTISGEPTKELVDEKFSNDFKLYEEQLVLVKAQSFNHAYKLAEKGAKRSEMTYKNPYDQTVQLKFLDSLDCFNLFDSQIKSGTEIYSRLIKKSIEVEPKTVIETLFPEALPDEERSTEFYNFLINE